MNNSEYLSTVEAIHEEARRRGVSFRVCEDEALRGRTVQLNGRELCSFSSCSYLGLEFHPALIEGTIDAVRRYGTQFSSSRGYLSAPPYQELESRLSEIFDGHALIASSTSLGHQMVLPVIATEKDAIVVDNQAHRSLQIAATLAQAHGATVEIVRHRELDEKALETVDRLARRHRTVYFACDGVYSMYGDCAPFGLLQQILDVAPNVRLYVDDAHGMSWAGTHGRGFFLSRMPLSERIIMGTSLNKAFAAGGGCFVFPTEAEREQVRMTGGPYVFSGPLQPPMMGAAIASAKVHLSNEIEALQETFRERVTLCNLLLREHNLPLLSLNEGPIFFIRLGKVEAAITVAEQLMKDGYHINISHYPAVPTKRAGLRLTLTALHSPEEIRGVVEALAHHVPRVLDEYGVSREELDTLFQGAVPREAWGGIQLGTLDTPAQTPPTVVAINARARRLPPGWKLETYNSIREIDRSLWDRYMGGLGASSWDALCLAEEVFRDQPLREHNWQFHYLLVRQANGSVVAMTYFTRCLNKDDMLIQSGISAEVERLRREDPYLLTSDVLLLGSHFSEGNHLYLDRSSSWKEALAVVTGEMLRYADEHSLSAVILREFPAEDLEMGAWMRAHDFLNVPQLHSHHLTIGGQDEEALLARASKRTRRFLQGLIQESQWYDSQIYGVHGRAMEPTWIAYLYDLYRQVASRKLRINVFPMPENLISALLQSGAWEILTLTLDPTVGGPEDGRPIAWCAAYRHDGNYAPFLCGVDYAYVEGREFGAYRQLLLQITRRARELYAHTLHLGMDADVEKGRFGARKESTCAYVFVRDHDYGDTLQQIVTSVSLRTARVA